MLRIAPERLAISSMIGPWFNGICFSLQLETDAGIGAAQLGAILGGAPGVVVVESSGTAGPPRPRSCDGVAALQVGRLRDDPAGGSVHLWAVADELRFGAAGNAIALLAALVEDDLI
jgi:aspartate-semialdehyde dehydrogenase